MNFEEHIMSNDNIRAVFSHQTLKYFFFEHAQFFENWEMSQGYSPVLSEAHSVT